MTGLKTGLEWLLGRLAGLLLVLMTLLVLYQVFTRYVLGDPADFTEELVRYLLMWTGFIGAAYAFATRQHMALIVARNTLPDRQKRLLILFVNVLILVFALLVIVIGGIRLALSARHEVSALLGISRGLVYSVAPLAGVFIVLAQVVNIWEDLTGRTPPDVEEETPTDDEVSARKEDRP